MSYPDNKVFLFFTIAALCFLFIEQRFWLSEAVGTPAKCPNSDVTVSTEIKADIAFACDAAEITFAFLMKGGLNTRVPVEIHIVEEIKELPHRHLYWGLYEKRFKRITVLSYNSCKKRFGGRCFCGIELCRRLHSSFIVHEIVHAIVDANFYTEIYNVATEEYIAYTTQFALLPDDLRQAILARINNEGFHHEREITTLFHNLNPSVFAVKAYRHFLRPENGFKFYKKLIAGQCRLRDE